MGAYGNTSAAAVSTFDPDNDGLFSYCEVRAGTNALHPDTDKDGVKDGADVEPTNFLAPNADGFNLSIMSDFNDPEVIDGTYSTGDKVNIRMWSSAKSVDWSRLNARHVYYELKQGSKIIQKGRLYEGEVTCDLSQNICTAQMDLAIAAGDYTLRLQIKDRDGDRYNIIKSITIIP